MPSLEMMLAFFGSAFLLALAPGPDNIFVLGQSVLYGSSAGVCTTCGLMTGVLVHTLLVTIGLSALLMTWPAAFMALKIAGAAYLLWLAWLSWRARTTNIDENAEGTFPGYFALYRRGVLMSLSNPKLVLFFLAFLPQFCVPGAGNQQILILGVLFVIASFGVFLVISLLAGRLATVLGTSLLAQLIIHRVSALIFAGLAITLFFVDAVETPGV